MAKRAILFHGDVLFVGPVMAMIACPHGGEVHQRPARHDADRELGLARRTRVHPIERERSLRSLSSGSEIIMLGVESVTSPISSFRSWSIPPDCSASPWALA